MKLRIQTENSGKSDFPFRAIAVVDDPRRGFEVVEVVEAETTKAAVVMIRRLHPAFRTAPAASFNATRW